MTALRKDLVRLNNKILIAKGVTIGPNFQICGSLLDELMNAKDKKRNVLSLDNLEPDGSHKRLILDSQLASDHVFKAVCRKGRIAATPDAGRTDRPCKCGLLHHFKPYLKLGPFKLELISRSPFVSILHDLISEHEISWMVEQSKPRLSRRRFDASNGEDATTFAAPYELQGASNKVRSVQKTVTYWFNDRNYSSHGFTVVHPVMERFSHRLELATGMSVRPRFSSSLYQTTNYGLAGLCEVHMDPSGYIEGKQISDSTLAYTGDMLATTMGWLNHVQAGGETAFHLQQLVLRPVRGSVAFWYNLDSIGHPDRRLIHGGCPVVKGSKWIVNKWINSFNQFLSFPCSLDQRKDRFFRPPAGVYGNVFRNS